MSKIGKQIITLPEGVTAVIADGVLEVKGKLGSLKLPVLKFISGKIDGNVLSFSTSGSGKQSRANWGTMRALAANAVKGVNEGYIKILEIEGIGFKGAIEGKTLVLNIGFTHPVRFEIPAGVVVVVEKGVMKVSGIDKALVGEAAAEIRAFKKPEPYKGTGIHYKGEYIRRKAGKKVAGAGAAAAA